MGRGKAAWTAMRLKRTIKPDPKIWLFSSTDNVKFNYNSKYLFLYVKDHLKQITPRYVINDPVLRSSLSMRYGSSYFIDTNTTEGVQEALQAGVWLTSAGLPLYGTGFAKGRRIINLWHGVPLKTVALLDPNLRWMSRLFFKQIFSNNYTDVVTTSQALSPLMQKSFAVPADKIRVWGQPRCDVLFEDFDRESVFRVKYPNMSAAAKMVLYAPTFRNGTDTRLFPFEDFDREDLERFLEEKDILLCIRLHLAETATDSFAPSERIRFLNEDLEEDVMCILSAFDALITDYSSIYIDDLLLDRPLIFLPYDLEDYTASHGFNFPYEDVTPGQKPKTYAQFRSALETAITDDGRQEERKRVRDLFFERQSPCCSYICNQILDATGIKRD